MKSLMTLINKNKYSQKQISAIIFVIILFLIPFYLCVQRPITTIDTSGYYQYYLKANLQEPNPELSFVIFSLIGKALFSDIGGFRFVLLIYELISFIVLLKILYKSNNPFLAFCIYFSFAYVYQMCIQMRSSIANLLLILALYDIRDRQPLKFYIKMLIAFFFHNQAILFFLIYPISIFIIKCKRKQFLYFLPIVVVLFSYFLGDLFYITLDYLTKLNSQYRVLSLLVVYSKLREYMDVFMNPLNRISLVLFIVYYIYLFTLGSQKLSDLQIICLSVILVSIFCYFFGSFNFPIIATRYPESFNLVLMIILVDMASIVKEKKMYFIFILLYLILINMQYGTVKYIMGLF